VRVAKDNNIRLSYQTAYRFPSTQNQWINLGVGTATLIGGLPQLREYYRFNTNPVYTPESVAAFGASAASGNPNPSLLQQQQFGEYKPESAKSFEVGYKSLIAEKVLIDVYGYYSQYENFLGRIAVIQSKNGNPLGTLSASTRNAYSVSVNSPTKVNTQGWGVSVEYALPKNFYVNANAYSDDIKNVPKGFLSMFNAPKFRTNIGFSNTGMGPKNRFGFNLVARYQDEVYFEGDFGTGQVPSFFTVDGQVNYKFPQSKSMIKLGATNLFNNYYQTAFGNPEIGGLYYVSFGYNIF
jgi:hypothetical protein